MDERQQETFEDRSAVIQAEAPRLISAAANCDDHYADVFYELTHRHTCYRADHKSSPSRRTTRSQAKTIEGVGIRHLSEKGHFHWASDGWAPISWFDGAMQTGAAGKSRRTCVQPLISAGTLPPEAPQHLTKAERIQYISALADTISGYDPAISQSTIEYQDVTRRTLVINSNGAAIQQQFRWTGVRISISLNINQQPFTAYLTQGSKNPLSLQFFDTELQLIQEVYNRVRRLTEAAPAPSGPQSVVFAGGWGGIWLHEVLGHALEADIVSTHPMQRRVGTDIADHIITITDDPTLVDGHGSFHFDDEGTPAQRTVLVENGRLRQLLTDRHTAAHRDYRLTGNGRRQDYRHLPLPRMTNLCLEGGTASPGDLISSIKSGIYVDQIRAGRFFKDADRFELDITGGHLIENGRLTYPVKNLTLAGRCSELLYRVKGVAQDQRPDAGTGQCKKYGQIVPISVYAPTVWIETLDAVSSPTSPHGTP